MSSIKKGSCFCKTFNCRGALQTAKKRRRHHDIDLLQEKSHTTESHMVNTSDVFENITSLYNIIHGKNKSESQPLFENSKWSKIFFKFNLFICEKYLGLYSSLVHTIWYHT